MGGSGRGREREREKWWWVGGLDWERGLGGRGEKRRGTVSKVQQSKYTIVR